MTKSNWMDRMMSDETAVMPPPPPPAHKDLAMFKTLDHQQILFREIATGELWGKLGVYSVCDKVTYHVNQTPMLGLPASSLLRVAIL
jgi:hypothetical protein